MSCSLSPAFCRPEASLLCAPTSFPHRPSHKEWRCTNMSLYPPESPISRSLEAEARPCHILLSPYPRTWRGVCVELCSVEKDLCQGNCKLFSGCVSLPRPKGKSGSVCKREAQKVPGDQGKGVCVGVGGSREERVCQSPAHTQRQWLLPLKD